MRSCLNCSKDLSQTHFNRKFCNSECRYQLYGPVARHSANQWRRENRERSLRNDHNKHLVKKYGITIEQYEQMSAQRGGRCDICGRTAEEVGDARRLAVDHCHTSGRIRGLLCRFCNTAIGQLQESITVIEKAAQYIRDYKND